MPHGSDAGKAAALAAYRSGRIAEAIELSQRVLNTYPGEAETTILLGLCMVKMGSVDNAISLLAEGVRLDPAAYDGLVWLSNLLRVRGRTQEALEYARRSVELQPKAPPGLAALGLCEMAVGQPELAVETFERALKEDPGSPPLVHNLARALQLAGRLGEAIALFQKSVDLTPRRAEAHISLGQALSQSRDRRAAAASFLKAYELESGSARGLTQLGKARIEQGLIEEAADALRRATALEPGSASSHGLLGNVLQQLGEFEAAVPELERAITLQPDVARPYFDLVYCRTTSESDRPLMNRLETMAAASGSPDDLRHVHYALGKARSDLKEFELAMAHFEEANAIMHQLSAPFRVEDERARFDMLEEVFTRGALSELDERRSSDGVPVLIVGMIRSGTTLLEQILSSHPDVAAGGEILFWQENAPLAVSGDRFDRDKAAELAGRYLEGLHRLAPAGGFVTDKMPLNFVHLGQIHWAVPNARIVHCRRNPLDTALSIFLTPFPSPVDFAHDKRTIVDYYRLYQRLMEHWRETLPADRFLEVDYEDVVENREAETRRILDFLGLDWNEACTAPADNRRVVRTPSLWQVRQPVYKSSVGRWHDYEPWLGPLAELKDG